jgi:excisionase family DNA binding protein
MDTSEMLLTVPQAAVRKGVSRTALYNAVTQGRLPHVRVLDKIGLRAADVDAWQPIAYRERAGAKPRGGRPKGFRLSEESRAKVAAAQRQRWAKRKLDVQSSQPMS